MSQTFECKRCHHLSKSKAHLLVHLRRKKTCEPLFENIPCQDLIDELIKKEYNEKTYECQFCGMRFNARSNKSRHLKTCQTKKAQEAERIKDTSELEILRREVFQLKEQMKASVTNNTINNTQNIGTVHIQVNALGNEDMTHFLESTSFRNVMTQFLKQREHGVCDLLIQKHFDPKHPENNNIKKLNKKDELIDVYDGSTWRPKFSEDVLDDVFRHLQNDFYEFIDEELCSPEGKLRPNWVKNFIELVGLPLDWDHSGIDMDISIKDLPDEEKAGLKKKIYRLALEYIYRKSKELHT